MEVTTLIDDLREKGYCLIEDVIPEDCCAEIRQRLLTVVEHQRSSTAPERVGFVPSVINHDQSFAPYLADPRLMQVATALLGHDLRISFTSVIVNEPGNARSGWHADWPFNQRIDWTHDGICNDRTRFRFAAAAECSIASHCWTARGGHSGRT